MSRLQAIEVDGLAMIGCSAGIAASRSTIEASVTAWCSVRPRA